MIKIQQNVLAVLSGARMEGPNLYLGCHLDRKMYLEVNKILEAAGGKWNKKAKAHVFACDAFDVIDPIIVSGEIERDPDIKKVLGQFDTPPELAQEIVATAFDGLTGELRVYEPSCGVGNIVGAIRKVALGREAPTHIFGNEIDPVRFKAAQAAYFQAGGLSNHDFLTVEPNPVFDLVVMNPPFAKQADIAHVRHALKFLKRGGKLVSIMSAGVTFREDRKSREFRELVANSEGAIKPLPDSAFKSSGTMVNTCLAKMLKLS